MCGLSMGSLPIYIVISTKTSQVFIQEVKAIHKTATSMEDRHLCASIAAYISGVFKFEPSHMASSKGEDATMQYEQEAQSDPERDVLKASNILQTVRI